MRSDIVPGAVFPDYELPDNKPCEADRSPFHGWNRWSPERFAAELERLAG